MKGEARERRRETEGKRGGNNRWLKVRLNCLAFFLSLSLSFLCGERLSSHYTFESNSFTFTATARRQ